MSTDPKQLVARDLEGQEHPVPASQVSWRPSVYGIVVRDEQVLLCRHFGKFNLPGGGMDLGERIEEALEREVYEETGIRVANPRLIGADTNLFKLPYGGAVVQAILLYYVCDYAAGEPSAEGWEADEQRYSELAQWVDVGTIDDWQITSTRDFREFVRAAVAQTSQD